MTANLNVVLLGVIISIIFYEITNISPGGIIVPGLMAMYITEPERIIYTLIVAIITYYLVKFISRYLIIFGKRKFVIMIIVSVVLNIILELIIHAASINLISVSLIGYTIAGLLAYNIDKQGLKRTIPSFVIVMMIVELIVIVVNAIGA